MRILEVIPTLGMLPGCYQREKLPAQENRHAQLQMLEPPKGFEPLTPVLQVRTDSVSIRSLQSS